MLSSKCHLTSKTSINHSFSCCQRKTPTFSHLLPSSQTKTNHHHPLTCASGVPQQPQHLSVGRISTSSGMTQNSTTKTFGTFGSQKLVLWVHVSPFSKAGPVHVNQRGVFWVCYTSPKSDRLLHDSPEATKMISDEADKK